MNAGVCAVYRRDLRRGEAEGAPCAREIFTPQTPQTPQTAGQRPKKLAGFSFQPKSLNPANPAVLRGLRVMRFSLRGLISPLGALFPQVNGHVAGFAALRGQFQPSTRARGGRTVTRRRGPTCRRLACGREHLLRPVRADHVRHAATVQAAIVAIWGTAGLTRYQAEARLQRLFARQAR